MKGCFVLALLAASGWVQAAAVNGQGTWETTLQPRDVDKDGVIDAYYDTTLDVTWMADANLAVTTGYDVYLGGRLRFPAVRDWIEYINSRNTFGISTWRLTTVTDIRPLGCTRGVDCGGYVDPNTSEFAHLHYVTLGNKRYCGTAGDCPQPGGGLTNTGPFENLHAAFYWTGTPYIRWNADLDYWQFDFERGSQLPNEGRAKERAYVWPVADGDIARGRLSSIHCPGDIDGDSIVDLALVMTNGEVVVKNIDGRVVSHAKFTETGTLIDTELSTDIDSNGSPEIVGLGYIGSEFRDLYTGRLLARADFWSPALPIDLELLPDVTGNGVPEVIELNFEGATVRDGMTGEFLGFRGGYDEFYPTTDVEVAPDLQGDGYSDLVILYDGKLLAPNVRKYFSAGSETLQQEVIADTNNNGFAEAAILRYKKSTGSYDVAVLDLSPEKQILGYIGMGTMFKPVRLMTISDINGNSADEVLVYSQEIDGDRHRVQIKDSKSRESIRSVYFDKNYTGVDATTCADIDGNGADEAVVLAYKPDIGSPRAIIKDTKSGALIRNVDF